MCQEFHSANISYRLLLLILKVQHSILGPEMRIYFFLFYWVPSGKCCNSNLKQFKTVVFKHSSKVKLWTPLIHDVFEPKLPPVLAVAVPVYLYISHSWRDAQLKHRDNFTFYFTSTLKSVNSPCRSFYHYLNYLLEPLLLMTTVVVETSGK